MYDWIYEHTIWRGTRWKPVSNLRLQVSSRSLNQDSDLSAMVFDRMSSFVVALAGEHPSHEPAGIEQILACRIAHISFGLTTEKSSHVLSLPGTAQQCMGPRRGAAAVSVPGPDSDAAGLERCWPRQPANASEPRWKNGNGSHWYGNGPR